MFALCQGSDHFPLSKQATQLIEGRKIGGASWCVRLIFLSAKFVGLASHLIFSFFSSFVALGQNTLTYKTILSLHFDAGQLSRLPPSIHHLEVKSVCYDTLNKTGMRRPVSDPPSVSFSRYRLVFYSSLGQGNESESPTFVPYIRLLITKKMAVLLYRVG
ncbi:hypothetical protein E2C01_042038 [Portunus trituberculatus]|uniref:Uncharacterized protein n=1 Tax=Portunus trituberculatus TaxID=210409 RepID=A0A5B7FKQ5_PORTR|nr:hypothetical protein [Portunus trituberculatus]